MNADQIKYMVNRFLQWRLPKNFNPDGGISFKRDYNENTPWPMKHEPVGTNLFDATQAEEMVRYMIDGMSHPPPEKRVESGERAAPAEVTAELTQGEVCAILLEELPLDGIGAGELLRVTERLNALLAAAKGGRGNE